MLFSQSLLKPLGAILGGRLNLTIERINNV